MALLIREQTVVLNQELYMEQRVEQKVEHRTTKNRLNILAVLLITSFGLVAPVNSCDRWLKTDVLQADHRTPEFVKRDQYRHPLKTLKFFEVKPEMTVVEIWPGKGWYTEVLAPYITKGKLYTAHFPTDAGVDYYDTNHALFVKKLEADPNVYRQVQMAAFDPKRNQLTVPDGSADRVLTFRNVHNWLRSESEATAFELFYKALKPGGVLGVVEHRALEGTDWETMKTSGYMTEQYVIDLAQKAGFILEAKSDINSNAKDTKNHPKGVWTLPPSLRLKEQDREKYLAIGESDRMTLKFRKPGGHH
jgi:predicted methyltransferase